MSDVHRGVTQYNEGSPGDLTAAFLRLFSKPRFQIIRPEKVGPTGYLDQWEAFEEGWGEDEHGRVFLNLLNEGRKIRFFQRYLDQEFPIIIISEDSHLCGVAEFENFNKYTEVAHG